MAMPRIPEAEVAALFETVLESDSDLQVRVTGRSMSPFLTGGDVVTIRRVPARRIRRGDVILFKNDRGTLILHRVFRKWKTRDGTMAFQTKGDALVGLDTPVGAAEVVGRVCELERPNASGQPALTNIDSFPQRQAHHLRALLTRVVARLRASGLSVCSGTQIPPFGKGGSGGTLEADHSDKSPSIPLFRRGMREGHCRKSIYRQSPSG